MSDITPTSAATQRTSADILQNIDNTVAKLTGGDAEKTKELFREVANIISGVSVRVSNGGTSGVDGNRDTTRTNGGTSTPSPGSRKARAMSRMPSFEPTSGWISHVGSRLTP